MKENQELFNILLQQLQIKDEDVLKELDAVQMTKVDVHPNKKEWHFYLSAPKRLHPHVYEMFQHALEASFTDIATPSAWWQFPKEHATKETLIDYWPTLYRLMSRHYPLLEGLLRSANIEILDEEIRIGLASQEQIQTFKTQFQQLIADQLQKASFIQVPLTCYVDESVNQKDHEAFMNRQNQEEEASIQAALQALEQQKNRPKVQQGDADLTIGKGIPEGQTITILDVYDNPRRQVIEGHIFAIEYRTFQSGTELMTMKITDYTSSVQVKMFSGRRASKEALHQFNKGEWIRLEGDLEMDNYTHEMVFQPRSIRKIKKASRQDIAPEGDKRIEFHLHSNMSQMDATNSATDLIKQAAAWGHPAIALTDHAAVQAFPEAYHAGKANGIKVIFGMEAYVVNDGEPIAYNPESIELEDATYVVFDVETTGLSAIYDSIIEIAGVKMHQGNIIDTYEAFINPGHPLSAFTTELTGITDAMLEDAPPEKQVMEEFKAFCEGTILVAHNASFDIGFINKTYERLGMEPSTLPVIDTLELSRLVNSDLRTHRLNTLARHYGVHLEQHHRAIYDSETTGFILYKLLEQALEDYQMTHHDQLNDEMGKGDSYKQSRPFHVTLLAKNQAGLKDLFKLVSISNINYFHRTPRIPRSVLNRYREHLLVGTACSEGEVFTAMMQKGYDEALELAKYYDYIEIQPPSVYEPLIEQELIRSHAALQDIMKEMVRLGEELDKLVIATGNVHYLDEKDHIYREILLRSMKINANRTLYLPKAHFRTTQEMLDEFDFLPQEVAHQLVVENTHRLNEQIEEVEVIKSDLYTPVIEGSDQEITDYTYEKAYQMYGNPLPEIVESRIKKELDSIISNGFSVIYLISQKLVLKSMDDGYLVGSRGSVGSSLVATLTGITEVNPLVPHYYCPNCQYNEFFTDGTIGSGYDLPEKTCPNCGEGVFLVREGQDIPFETFLGFYGDKVPDIDLNFSGVYQPTAHAYTKELFGEDYVYRAGTISTVAERTAFGYVRGYLEHTQEELPQAEKERLAKGIEGVKRTTGQHPGGIIVIPENMDVFDFTPIQFPADDTGAEWRTTHFDFHSIDENVLKLDILGHDDPTVIRMLQDLSGIDPSTINPTDEDVMTIFTSPKALGVEPEQIFSSTGTLGIPEFGTEFVRNMLEEAGPKNFAELIQISGLSHGTDVWLNNARDLINNNIAPLSEVIGLRDDIMTTLIYYGLDDGLAFTIMESVRKGRGLTPEWEDKMREHNVPEWYIGSCKKIKYMFPKAHAVAYVLMALRVAYFKVHYPLYYYAAYFSVRAKEFDIVAMHQGKEMVKRRIREINDKGFDATVTDRNLLVSLELANEMIERGYKFQMIDINKSDAENFLIEGDTLIPPFRSIPGLGLSVAEQIVAARKGAPFLSKEDIQKRGRVSKTVIEYLTDHGVIQDLPDENQLSLFDMM